MYVFEELFANRIMWVGVLAWFVAQAIKVLIAGVREKRLNARLLFSLGGMPSSHSATVCALVVSTAFCYGVSAFEFAVSFVLAAVVMYDAIGVRQETGKQARLLNMILEQDLFKLNNHQFQERLKEFVGHTPLQVFAGAVLGILLAVLVNLAY